MDLASRGYVEEEYFVHGQANRYRIKDPLGTAEVVDGGHPYTTRILVRRPKNPSKFNGIVLLEWYNVSGDQDVDFVFAAIRDHLVDEGYAWVGVSAQLQGAEPLKVANPARYASINLAASNEDPHGGILDKPTGPPRPDAPADVLSWDVYSQIGAALRNSRTPNALRPLGNLRPKMVIATGESQSAFRLTDYYNSIQPLYPDLFEGYLTYDRVMHPQRTDMKAKHLSVGTEAFPSPPPDNPNLRLWEVAGASHLSFDDVSSYVDEQILRSGIFLPGGKPSNMTSVMKVCAVQPPFSRVPTGEVVSAGLEALIAWVRNGKTPPTAPRMARDGEQKVLRDADGRAAGGIRLAAYDAPMSRTIGSNTGGPYCGIIGSHVDYSAAEMCSRYGSPQNYVARVVAVTRKAQRDGFLLKGDADRTIQQAKRLTFACGSAG
ncbi:alpha/beta hydrolase domain-containing protein [Sphingobium sp. H39-3-25]|nr:alpha/beta hydrolase domain-containing protein [Sphingobium arseniciresistens]